MMPVELLCNSTCNHALATVLYTACTYNTINEHIKVLTNNKAKSLIFPWKIKCSNYKYKSILMGSVSIIIVSTDFFNRI